MWLFSQMSMEPNSEVGAEQKPVLSASSRWNIIFMKRTNRLAIAMFVGGILFKIIQHLFFK
jgi:hypothetical protein